MGPQLCCGTLTAWRFGTIQCKLGCTFAAAHRLHPAHASQVPLPGSSLPLPAPAYQLQQYYVYGEVDDCFSKWTAFFDCLKKKTKYKEEVGGPV